MNPGTANTAWGRTGVGTAGEADEAGMDGVRRVGGRTNDTIKHLPALNMRGEILAGQRWPVPPNHHHHAFHTYRCATGHHIEVLLRCLVLQCAVMQYCCAAAPEHVVEEICKTARSPHVAARVPRYRAAARSGQL